MDSGLKGDIAAHRIQCGRIDRGLRCSNDANITSAGSANDGTSAVLEIGKCLGSSSSVPAFPCRGLQIDKQQSRFLFARGLQRNRHFHPPNRRAPEMRP